MKRVLHFTETREQAENFIKEHDLAGKAEIKEKIQYQSNSRKSWTYKIYAIIVSREVYFQITYGG